jgi:hypothetical protein
MLRMQPSNQNLQDWGKMAHQSRAHEHYHTLQHRPSWRNPNCHGSLAAGRGGGRAVSLFPYWTLVGTHSSPGRTLTNNHLDPACPRVLCGLLLRQPGKKVGSS